MQVINADRRLRAKQMYTAAGYATTSEKEREI